MSNFFLVQLDGTPTFLTSLRDGKPYGSSYPTQAIPMSFDAATELCNRFRSQGYEAVVVDRFGQPPTADDLSMVKRQAQYQVRFHGRYFVGQNANNQDLGNSDRAQAASMSQEAAIVVCTRLKRMGFIDAVVLESTSPVVDVVDELTKIWPEEFSAKNK